MPFDSEDQDCAKSEHHCDASSTSFLPIGTEPIPEFVPARSPGQELLEILQAPPQKQSAPPPGLSDTGCISGGTGGTPGMWDFGSFGDSSDWQLQPENVASDQSTSLSKGQVEDDVGLRLEAMVEELAGVHSFELLEDAFVKVDAARAALSKVVSAESNLQLTAPAFVPGQIWPGSQ